MLALLSAALTQFLGLHALLGAFVFGVLLSQSPRTTQRLLENIQTLTVSLFGPIFFVVAGMRVDILQINSVSAVLWESTLVGFGLNLKGGTDVIVAMV